MNHFVAYLIQGFFFLFCSISLVIAPAFSPLDWPTTVAYADDDDGGDDDGGDDDGGPSGGGGGGSGGGGSGGSSRGSGG